MLIAGLLAQAVVAVVPAPQQEGVSSYSPEFFAAQQPGTAIDMLNRYVKPFVEYRPRPDLNIRLEMPNVTRRNLHDTFYIYPGLRTASAQPNFIDDRNTNATAGSTFLRVRKTFG